MFPLISPNSGRCESVTVCDIFSLMLSISSTLFSSKAGVIEDVNAVNTEDVDGDVTAEGTDVENPENSCGIFPKSKKPATSFSKSN